MTRVDERYAFDRLDAAVATLSTAARTSKAVITAAISKALPLRPGETETLFKGESSLNDLKALVASAAKLVDMVRSSARRPVFSNSLGPNAIQWWRIGSINKPVHSPTFCPLPSPSLLPCVSWPFPFAWLCFAPAPNEELCVSCASLVLAPLVLGALCEQRPCRRPVWPPASRLLLLWY